MTATTSPVARLQHAEGTTTHGHSWCSEATAVDDHALARAHSPVLDIGCGPGRHLVALAGRGVLALGIDLTPRAVALARGRGAAVLQRSVFAQLPGQGRWRTALLLDGNIGIGGDPLTLLRRVGELLHQRGTVLVEVDAPGSKAARDRGVSTACLELDGVAGPWFPWTRVGAEEIGALARESGFVVHERWDHGTRHFAELVRANIAPLR